MLDLSFFMSVDTRYINIYIIYAYIYYELVQ